MPPTEQLPRNDIRLYDRLADQWWRPRGVFAMLHWLAAARGELVPPPERAGAVLVDLGCGAGLLAPHVRGYRHIGVDMSASGLRQAREHGVTAVRGDVLRVPLRDGCADVVVAGEILEHVTDLDAAVREIGRVLAPDGLLVLDTLAATRRCRFVAIGVAERVPGMAPRGVHDPRLLVDRAALVKVAAEVGIPLRLRGIRPVLSDVAGWLLGRRDSVRLRPVRDTGVLFQGVGRKVG
ncbi:bifunctional 2-polyprenyl-6-hydroxyphenol methylase/3-demethylubiquinol 3-O-methyltransferase UbiG [Actinokineospora sp. UTMC 2448]|uniref:class I SAM-dependent methyltransferase n=1 Tax=Actinokineospora sp. UTMC 2448 TaxID=2268449 RepID=UPI002164C611|nr:methyltransferase domain-containing protein [Actinokineospora sp. UTMC 2448]